MPFGDCTTLASSAKPMLLLTGSRYETYVTNTVQQSVHFSRFLFPGPVNSPPTCKGKSTLQAPHTSCKFGGAIPCWQDSVTTMQNAF